jgi:hypothetical protein
VNIHAYDQMIFDAIDVLDRLVEESFTREIVHDLVYIDHGVTGRVVANAGWLNVRVDDAPLVSPIGADRFVAVNASPVHAIRPVDRGMHQGENGIDIAPVERSVGSSDEFSVRRHKFTSGFDDGSTQDADKGQRKESVG